MKTSETALTLIRTWEGFRSQPYRCPAGYTTIGYGHVIHPGEALTRISRRDAEQLLQSDVESVEQALYRLIRRALLQHQFDALISFTFNVGAGAFQRSRLRQCVNRGHHALVPREFMKWVHSHGKALPGLVSRRIIEARLYQGTLSETYERFPYQDIY